MWAILGLLLLLVLIRLWVSGDVAASTEAEARSAAPGKPVEVARVAESRPAISTKSYYLAACPCCGERLTRRSYFTWQIRMRMKCRRCHTALQSNFKLDTICCAISVSPFAVCFFLAVLGGYVSWSVVLATLIFHFASGYIFFPYVTKMEIARDQQEPHSATPMV